MEYIPEEKKWVKPVVYILVVVLIILVFLWHNSFSLMLRVNGLSRDGVRYIAELDESRSIGSKGEKIFQTTTKDGELALGVAQKNKLGIWRIQLLEVTTQEDRFINMIMVESSAIRKYESKDGGWENGWHFVYCGDDAIDLVVLHEEQLPENTAVKIWQANEFYLIYLVTYGDRNNSFDVHAALEENGCVKPLS